MLLAADIGGTKSLFALCEFHNDKLNILAQDKYPSKSLITLQETVICFLNEPNVKPLLKKPITAACFSLAGPIDDGYCHLVNLGLTISCKEVRSSLSFIPHIEFCNDLAAVGHGLSLLSDDELFCLTPEIERAKPSGNKAIIAPGTGLGESLIMGGNVYPSEGAHSDFGPRSEEEVRLWRFLHKKFNHVSYERILSGPGLQNIYAFLLEESLQDKSSSESLTSKLLTPSEISSSALANTCPFCRQALHMFVRILGAEAGNLALRALAYGGIYLGGGIPPQILLKLQDKAFLEAFQDKGRFVELMKQIPIYVILNDQAALYGAALLARQKS